VIELYLIPGQASINRTIRPVWADFGCRAAMRPSRPTLPARAPIPLRRAAYAICFCVAQNLLCGQKSSTRLGPQASRKL